ncbi:hypothetical protein B0H21DRAFT_153867 [Amylocystis lapponica]|nr:hypothetical protein B0H21DRAFT_153867 [Amylocystis lapponica]
MASQFGFDGKEILDMEELPRRPQSQMSKRSLASTHLIPHVEQRPPRYEPLVLRTWFVMTLAATMISIAIALEVALRFSTESGGFPIYQNSIFGWAPLSFLTASLPILFLAPIAMLWSATDWGVRCYQPYVLLSRGYAKSKDTVLLDYMSLNKFLALFVSFRRQHWLVLASLITAFATNLVQPLAGAILDVKVMQKGQFVETISKGTVGLAPDITSLNAFSSAAGFTDAATFQSLPNPPFVLNEWAVAQFELPPVLGANAIYQANIPGIQTSVNCMTASVDLDKANDEVYILGATTDDGCSGRVAFNPTSADQQYGVSQANNTLCGMGNQTVPQLSPVFFWFFRNVTDNQDESGLGQAAAVICRPSIKVQQVLATVSVNNTGLLTVTPLNNYTTPNNVTGSPLNEQAYNGLLIGDTQEDYFVTARATSISTGIPSTILRLALQIDPTLKNFSGSNDELVDAAERIYLLFLAVSAKSIYFVPATQNITVYATSEVQRLVIEPIPTHGLASLLLVIAVTGMIVHILHRMHRRDLYLTMPPGSIAASLALAYHSGIGEILVPYDTEEDMLHKLRGLHFGLDRRTGAVVAEEREDYDSRSAYDVTDADDKALLPQLNVQ